MSKIRDAWLESIPVLPSRDLEPTPFDSQRLAALGKELGYPTFERRANRYMNQLVGDFFYEPLLFLTDVVQTLICMEEVHDAIGGWQRGPYLDLSIDMYPSFFDAPGGILPAPEPSERLLGEHVVGGIRLEPIEGSPWPHVRFQHLMGLRRPSWGAGGQGFASLPYLQDHLREAWAVRAHAGPLVGSDSWAPDPEARSHLDPESWARSSDVTSEVVEVCPDDFQIVLKRYHSLVQGCPQLAFEMRAPLGPGAMTFAWMHVSPLLSDGTEPPDFLVHELFVWPHWREMHVATWLANTALGWLKQKGFHRCAWLQPRADLVVARHSPLAPRLPGWLSSLDWSDADFITMGAATELVDVSDILRDISRTWQP